MHRGFVRSLVYNSVTVSLPKNAVQFMLGVVLFWLVTGSFSAPVVLAALSAFLLAYSSVYLFNDIADFEDDRKDGDKRVWKLVASGMLSKRGAAALGAALLLSGGWLAGMVNGWFLALIVALVFLNFLHSSPQVRLKKRKATTAVNMTAIEFLKYSSGWFALTPDLVTFPFWLIMCFSLIYTAIYMAYKLRFKGSVIREHKAILYPLGAGVVFSFVASLVLYPYALPLLFLLGVSLLMAKASIGRKLRFMNWLWVEFAILPLILVAFLMLAVQPIAEANDNLTATICACKESIYQNLPEGIAEDLSGLEEPMYSSLDEFQEVMNLSSAGFLAAPKNK